MFFSHQITIFIFGVSSFDCQRLVEHTFISSFDITFFFNVPICPDMPLIMDHGLLERFHI
jgi:hypothetical protein